MRLTVTNEGVQIPRSYFRDAKEVEVVAVEDGVKIIVPEKEDPIFQLGEAPVTIPVSDGSVNHDKYLYGTSGEWD